jgi:hypothetical protein
MVFKEGLSRFWPESPSLYERQSITEIEQIQTFHTKVIRLLMPPIPD